MDDNSVGASVDAEGVDSPIPKNYANVPANFRKALQVAHADKVLAKYEGDTTEILNRLTDGESVVQVAADLGISHQSLYAWLLRNDPDKWMALSAGKALARVEKAEQDMDKAPDQLEVSRARESHKMGAWALERAARKLYGDNKAENQGVQIQVVIARDGEVVIEAEK